MLAFCLWGYFQALLVKSGLSAILRETAMDNCLGYTASCSGVCSRQALCHSDDGSTCSGKSVFVSISSTESFFYEKETVQLC